MNASPASPTHFETRRVEPELLETYPANHPDAVRSRADLRLINAVMDNHRWIVHKLRRLCQPGGRVTEIGAGELPARLGLGTDWQIVHDGESWLGGCRLLAVRAG